MKVLDAKDVVPPEPKPVPINPGFTCPNEHVINTGNSLDDDPRLCITMLEALCLLKDLKKLSYSAEQNVAELCQLVANVTSFPFPRLHL